MDRLGWAVSVIKMTVAWGARIHMGSPLRPGHKKKTDFEEQRNLKN